MSTWKAKILYTLVASDVLPCVGLTPRVWHELALYQVFSQQLLNRVVPKVMRLKLMSSDKFILDTDLEDAPYRFCYFQ